MEKWENHFDSKFLKFEKSREDLLNKKSQKMFHRSLERSQLCEKAWEKKLSIRSSVKKYSKNTLNLVNKLQKNKRD